jgi:hypothetical protein
MIVLTHTARRLAHLRLFNQRGMVGDEGLEMGTSTVHWVPGPGSITGGRHPRLRTMQCVPCLLVVSSINFAFKQKQVLADFGGGGVGWGGQYVLIDFDSILGRLLVFPAAKDPFVHQSFLSMQRLSCPVKVYPGSLLDLKNSNRTIFSTKRWANDELPFVNVLFWCILFCFMDL